MYIPEQVKIGGTVYNISIVEAIKEHEFATGIFDENGLRIDIKDNEFSTVIEKTFIHELVHALHAHMGLNQEGDESLSESYVEGFASALHMALVDNPKLFRR